MKANIRISAAGNKCFTLALALVMVFCSWGTVFGASNINDVFPPVVSDLTYTLPETVNKSGDNPITRGEFAEAIAFMCGMDMSSGSEGYYVNENDTLNISLRGVKSGRYFDVDTDDPAFDAITFLNQENIMWDNNSGSYFYSDKILQVWEFSSAISRLCDNAGENDVDGVLDAVFGYDFDYNTMKNQEVTATQLTSWLDNLWKLMGLNIGPVEVRNLLYMTTFSPNRVKNDQAEDLTYMLSLDNTFALILSSDNGINTPYFNRVPDLVPLSFSARDKLKLKNNIAETYFGTNQDWRLNGPAVTDVGYFIVGANGTYYHTQIDALRNETTKKVTVSGIENETIVKKKSGFSALKLSTYNGNAVVPSE